MRAIKYIVLHCTATDKEAKPESILKYWRERMKWRNPGYHFIVEDNGDVTQFQPIDKPSNGVRGYNKNSIHVCYIGGKDEDDRSLEQLCSLEGIVKTLHAFYPDAEIKGHRDFLGVSKSCPRFDVKQWLKEIKLYD